MKNIEIKQVVGGGYSAPSLVMIELVSRLFVATSLEGGRVEEFYEGESIEF